MYQAETLYMQESTDNSPNMLWLGLRRPLLLAPKLTFKEHVSFWSLPTTTKRPPRAVAGVLEAYVAAERHGSGAPWPDAQAQTATAHLLPWQVAWRPLRFSCSLVKAGTIAL